MRTLSQVLKFPQQGMASVLSEWIIGASHRCVTAASLQARKQAQEAGTCPRSHRVFDPVKEGVWGVLPQPFPWDLDRQVALG